MTREAVIDLVIGQWRHGIPVREIMRALIARGEPALKSDVLRIIRMYCDLKSENRALGGAAREESA